MTNEDYAALNAKLDRMLDLIQRELAASRAEAQASDAIAALAKQAELLERMLDPIDSDYPRRELDRLEREFEHVQWQLALQSDHAYKHYQLLKERLTVLRKRCAKGSTAGLAADSSI